RHTSALTPNAVPPYSPPAPAVLATRVAVVSRSIATLTRHPSRSSRARSARPMPIRSSRDAFAARSKNVPTVGKAVDGGPGNPSSSASPSSAEASARSSRGAACSAPTSLPPTAVVPAPPTRPATLVPGKVGGDMMNAVERLEQVRCEHDVLHQLRHPPVADHSTVGRREREVLEHGLAAERAAGVDPECHVADQIL